MSKLEFAIWGAEAIVKIGRAILDVHTDKVTPEQGFAAVQAAVQRTSDVDARVDQALRDKWPDEGGKP